MARDRFTIIQSDNQRDSFGPYWYEIYRNDDLVAHVWHDYRGSESGIDFVDRRGTKWPFINVTEFLTGGGPDPIDLTDDAVQYLIDELID